MSELDPSAHPEIVGQAWEAALAANRAVDVIRELDETIALVKTFGFLAIVGGSNKTQLTLDHARTKVELHFDDLTDMAAATMLPPGSPFSTNKIAAAKADELSVEPPRQLSKENRVNNAGDLIAQLLVAQPNKTLSVEELTRTVYNSDGGSIKNDRAKILALISNSEIGRSTKICDELQNNGLVLQVGRMHEYDPVTQQRSNFLAKVIRAIARAEVIDEAGVYSTEITDNRAEIDWQTILILPS